MKPTDKQVQTLALINTLKDLNFDRKILEVSLIAVLELYYDSNPIKVIRYLSELEEKLGPKVYNTKNTQS